MNLPSQNALLEKAVEIKRINKKRGRKCILDNYKETIIVLRRKQLSWKQICEFLNSNNISCKYPSLIHWKRVNLN